MATASADFIAKARAQLLLPEAQRSLFVNGSIAAGNAGVNTGWSWHFSDAALVEMAIELCDGRPSMVEANQDTGSTPSSAFAPGRPTSMPRPLERVKTHVLTNTIGLNLSQS